MTTSQATTPATGGSVDGRQNSDRLGQAISHLDNAPPGGAQAAGAFCQPPTSDIAAAGVHNGIPFDRYPASPGFKTHGPSSEAAEAIAPIASTIRDRVLKFVSSTGEHGATADEVTAALNISAFTTRPRLSELRRLGRIKDSGARRAHLSGVDATVWTAADSRGAAS